MKNLFFLLIVSLYGVHAFAQQQGRLMYQYTHNDNITAMDIDANGRWLASVDNKYKLHLWDFKQKKLLRVIKGFASRKVTQLKFSPNAQMLATGSFDNVIKVWQRSTGQLLHTLSNHSSRVTSLSFSPDGRTLVSGGHDDAIFIWDLKTGYEVAKLTDHTLGIVALHHHPNGKYLVSADRAGQVLVWNLAQKKVVRKFKAYERLDIRNMVLSHDGTKIMTTNQNNHLDIWDFGTGKKLKTINIEKRLSNILRVNKEGSQALVNNGREVLLINLKDGQVAHAFRQKRAITDLLYTPNQQEIIVGDSRGGLQTMKANDGAPLSKIYYSQGRITQMQVKNQALLINDRYSPVLVWQNGQWVTLAKSKYHRAFWVGDQQKIVGISRSEYAAWNSASGEQLQKLSLKRVNSASLSVTSSSGKYIVVLNYRKLTVLQTGSQLDTVYTIAQKSRDVKALSFSPDESMLAVGKRKGEVSIYDFKNKQELTTFRVNDTDKDVLAWSNDSKQLLVANSLRKGLIAYDIASKAFAYELSAPNNIITTGISPDNRYLVTGHHEGDLTVYRTSNRKELKRLLASSRIEAIAFTADSKKMITACQDGEIVFWSLPTQTRLLSLWMFNRGKDFVAYTPGGRFDGTAKGLERLHWVHNDSVMAMPAKLQVRGLIDKILKGKLSEMVVANNNNGGKVTKGAKDHKQKKVISNHKKVESPYTYQNIVLVAPAEPVPTIRETTQFNHTQKSLVIKGHIKNVPPQQIKYIKVNNRRTTFDRKNLIFTSQKIFFRKKQVRNITIEVFTKNQKSFSREITVAATFKTSADQPELVVTQGHRKAVTAIDFHPSGKYYVTASEDNTLKIWDWALKQEFRTLQGHQRQPNKVVYSPNGQYIASFDDNEVILWQHPSGQIIRRFKSRGKNALLFTADSKHIYFEGITAVTNSHGSFLKVSTATGAVVKYYGFGFDDHAQLHPNGKVLFNERKTYDLETGEKLPNAPKDPTTELSHHRRVSTINKTYFASCQDTEKILRIWNLNKLEEPFLRIKLPLKKDVHSIKFTHDGKKIVVADEGYQLLVYGLPKGKLLRKITHKDYGMGHNERYEYLKKGGTSAETGPFKGFAISPDDRLIAANARVVGYGNSKQFVNFEVMIGVRFFLLKNGKTLGTFGRKARDLDHISVTRNEKYLVSLHSKAGAGARIWNLRKGQIDAFVPKGTGSAFSDGKYLAIFYYKPKLIKVYKIPTLAEAFTIKTKGNAESIYLSPSHKLLVFKESTFQNQQYRVQLKVLNIENPKKPQPIQSFNAFQQTPSNGLARLDHIKSSPDDKYLLAIADSSRVRQVRCFDLATGKVLSNFKLNTQNDRMLDFVPNTHHLLVAKQIEREDRQVYTRLLEVDYLTGKVIAQLDTDYQEIYDAKFDADGQYLVTGSGGDEYDSRNIYYDVAIWDWQSKNLNCAMAGHSFNVRHVWFGAKGKRVYSADENGIIKIWNIRKCKLSSSFLGLDKANYLIINPENYYKSSKGSFNHIGFRYKGQLREIGQFDLKFNRPDLVIKDLGGSKLLQRIYYKAWRKRLQRSGVTDALIADAIHLPEVSISNRATLPSVTQKDRIELKIEAEASEVPLKYLQVYVNGVPLYSSQGISAKNRKKMSKSLSVMLNEGLNKISVKAVNINGLESVKESINVTYNSDARRPNLYALVVGVSQYDNQDRNLKFAQKDANDLANLLEQQKSKNYGKVVVTRVLDKQATREAIVKASKLFKNTRPDDQVIIYISCHGLLDDQLNYYLATTNVDFKDPAQKGLPYESIEKMLEGVPARNRLIMIDACHSGELDKSEVETTQQKTSENVTVAFKGGGNIQVIRPKTGLKNSFDYMKALFSDVSNNTGATIISAAAGYEFALESKEWNNGVFTYAILEGVKSGKADFNKDGQVSLSELKNYVIEEVSKLTNGQQVPTTRRENQSVDVVLFKK